MRQHGVIIRACLFLIGSNLYIAAAAAIIAVQTQVQMGLKPHIHPYLFVIFFATFFEYNLHRLVHILIHKEDIHKPKYAWIKKHYTFFMLSILSSIIGLGWSLFYVKWQVLLVLIPLGVLTLFYSLPFSRPGKHIFRLREIYIFKIFLIALVWSATTVILPLAHSDVHIGIPQMTGLLLDRFLFVFAITVPFDIRDMETDRKNGLKTIPLLIGVKKSILLADLMLIGYFLAEIYLFIKPGTLFLLAAGFLSFISTLYFINSSRIKHLPYYHYGILDGTLILQGFLTLAAYYCFLHYFL